MARPFQGLHWCLACRLSPLSRSRDRPSRHASAPASLKLRCFGQAQSPACLGMLAPTVPLIKKPLHLLPAGQQASLPADGATDASSDLCPGFLYLLVFPVRESIPTLLAALCNLDVAFPFILEEPRQPCGRAGSEDMGSKRPSSDDQCMSQPPGQGRRATTDQNPWSRPIRRIRP